MTLLPSKTSPRNRLAGSLASRGPARRSAFTFIEVLFAVILLGIGFILVAAIFPVAIQQAQATANDTQGTLVARDAMRLIEACASNTYYISSTNPNQTYFMGNGSLVVPFNLAESGGAVQAAPYLSPYNALGGNTFMSADGRYGWTAFYRRFNLADPYMQVWVFALENPTFTSTGNAAAAPPNVPPIIPNSATCSFTYTAGAPATVTFSGAAPANAVEGAFVLISNDGNTSQNNPLNGRVLRLGSQTSNPNVFDLQPGFDITATDNSNFPSSLSSDTVYIIGRAPDTQTPTTYDGSDQDIALQTSFVRVNN